jgi:hypothetical protein
MVFKCVFNDMIFDRSDYSIFTVWRIYRHDDIFYINWACKNFLSRVSSLDDVLIPIFKRMISNWMRGEDTHSINSNWASRLECYSIPTISSNVPSIWPSVSKSSIKFECSWSWTISNIFNRLWSQSSNR